MFKTTIQYKNFILKQIQLGYFSIDMQYYLGDSKKKHQRTLLASNIYVIESGNEIWILDTGYSDSAEIDWIHSRLKRSFKDIINHYCNYYNVNIIISHAHPDHISGLIEVFELIKKKKWKVFYDLKALNYYTNFDRIYDFLKNDLSGYEFLFPRNLNSKFEVLYEGGHSPEHVVLKVKGEPVYYCADLYPTQYHLEQIPVGEKNYDQKEFEDMHREVKKRLKKENATLLLSHAPNNGIIKL